MSESDFASPESSREDQFFGVKSKVGEKPEVDSDVVDIVDDSAFEEESPSVKVENSFDDDVSEEELQTYSQKVQKRINKLRATNHADRRKRGEIEQTLQEHEKVTQKLHSENQNLKKMLRQGETAIIDSVQKRTGLEIARAEEDFKSAHESGDTEKIVQAQKSLNIAQNRQMDVEGRAQRLKKAPPIVDTPPPIASRPRLSETQERWQRENPWFQPTAAEGAQVPSLHKEMTAVGYAIHDTLTRELGIDPVAQEDRYYSEINKRIRSRFPDYFGEDVAEEETRQAPVARNNNNVVSPSTRNNGVKTRKLRLTASQADVAKKLGLTNAQYAAEFVKI